MQVRHHGVRCASEQTRGACYQRPKNIEATSLQQLLDGVRTQRYTMERPANG